jgi:hypothetical protein
LIDLDKPVGFEFRSDFDIREGGHAVASGTITDVSDLGGKSGERRRKSTTGSQRTVSRARILRGRLATGPATTRFQKSFADLKIGPVAARFISCKRQWVCQFHKATFR